MTFGDVEHAPRLKDTMKAADLDTDGCVELARVVLRDAANALTEAARTAAGSQNPEHFRYLKMCQDFYRSDLFAALSCGLVNGETVMQQITKRALRGMKIE